MTKDCKEVFTEIYRSKVWGDGSGGGSGEQAQPYCDFITQYLSWPITLTVLDIGCGDLSIARRIKWGVSRYIGIDATSGWNQPDEIFNAVVIGAADALYCDLPAADLVLCKEVMQHLSNEQVQLLLDRTAHYQRRLFTNSKPGPEVTENEDIDTGGFRPVDLSLPPFNQPCKTILEYGCWHVQELRR
jgi:SAM-dependent methyltransferase